MDTKKLLSVIVFALATAGCAGTGVHHKSNPVSVAHVHQQDLKSKTQTTQKKQTSYEAGVASWYGRKFHGKKTASGALYDQNLYTAAHNTLPMMSVVKVTNLANSKTVTVLINDRGPFGDASRVIDLSRKAAQEIGIRRTGLADVVVEKVDLADGVRRLAILAKKEPKKYKILVEQVHKMNKAS